MTSGPSVDGPPGARWSHGTSAPALVLAAARRGHARRDGLRPGRRRRLPGLALYYAYSYVAYALSPFNDAFLLYVATLGLAGYALLDGLLRLDLTGVGPAMAQTPRRPVGWFLIAVGVLFVGLWLAMIRPALPGGLPEGRVTYDIASVIHVLDLAFVLALLSMNLFVDSPSSGEMALWALIAAVSASLLAATLRRTGPVADPWMRESLWGAAAVLTPQGVSSKT